MIDEVNYAIPMGILGRLANWLFVGRQVNAIFDHRYEVLEDYFSPERKVDNVKLLKTV
jgi:ligand-binding SRPBCC domain-containing protein